MEYTLYRKFYEESESTELVDLLRARGIEVEVVKERDSLDSLYGDKTFSHRIFVKISQEDFARADAVLLEHTGKALDQVDKDHYLFGFSDDELYEIIAKPDEWSELDYLLAQRILKERGKPVDSTKVEKLKGQRIEELAKPAESQRLAIFAGYFLSLLGGVIGIFIGYHLHTYKKILPDGNKVYGYLPEDRRDGLRIMILGLICSFIYLLLRFTLL